MKKTTTIVLVLVVAAILVLALSGTAFAGGAPPTIQSATVWGPSSLMENGYHFDVEFTFTGKPLHWAVCMSWKAWDGTYFDTWGTRFDFYRAQSSAHKVSRTLVVVTTEENATLLGVTIYLYDRKLNTVGFYWVAREQFETY